VKMHPVGSCTPLHIAARIGDYTTVVSLLENGESPNSATFDGLTPLIFAAHMGHDRVVARLIEAGADTNKEANNGVTPLCIAAQNGRIAIVDSLLEAGASWKIRRYEFAGAWHTFRMDVAKLLEAGADANAATIDMARCAYWGRKGTTPLCVAAQYGHGTVVDSLLEAGADRELATEMGMTPLILAAQNGHTAVIQVASRVHFLYTKPHVCPGVKP